MAIFLFLIAFIAIAGGFLFLTKKTKRLPPGPKGLPIIGPLHHDLLKLAKKHGPIMYMRFGLVPHIIVSSPDAAELFLKTYDLVFASRPQHQASKIMSWDQKNLTFASYGPYWRNMRKLCTLELLGTQRLNSFKSMRKKELILFIESIKLATQESDVVDLGAKLSSLTADMNSVMVLGKKYENKDVMHERGFKGAIQDGMKLGARPNLADYFPFLGSFDLQGLGKKMKVLAKVYNDFFEKVIDDHVKVGDKEQTKGLVGTMMSIIQSGENEFQIDRRHIKSITLDMFFASVDTSASTSEWVLSELIKNPRIMRKVQKELEEVVGLERTVEEYDLDKLEYLYMVIKETFRLHPVAPLLLPHLAMEDCTVNGYDIPKGSQIFINSYAIARDPNVWTDPEKFFPERFIGSDVDILGQHFELLPFGSGRRGCPGMQLGLIQVRLIVAQLVHCFDWKLPYGMKPDELDMTGEFSIVVSRTNPLMLVPTYRLHN